MGTLYTIVRAGGESLSSSIPLSTETGHDSPSLADLLALDLVGVSRIEERLDVDNDPFRIAG